MSRLDGTPRGVAIQLRSRTPGWVIGRNGELELESWAMPSCSASVECCDMGEPAEKGVQKFFFLPFP